MCVLPTVLGQRSEAQRHRYVLAYMGCRGVVGVHTFSVVGVFMWVVCALVCVCGRVCVNVFLDVDVGV